MSEWIPDPDLFMMCRSPEPQEFTALPASFYFDLCREEELDIWRAFPFDEKAAAQEFSAYMKQYFDEVYRPKGDLFFTKCLFVRNAEGVPVATGFLWKAYDRINTLHWLKVKKEWSGRRAAFAEAVYAARRLDSAALYIRSSSVSGNGTFIRHPRILNRLVQEGSLYGEA